MLYFVFKRQEGKKDKSDIKLFCSAGTQSSSPEEYTKWFVRTFFFFFPLTPVPAQKILPKLLHPLQQSCILDHTGQMGFLRELIFVMKCSKILPNWHLRNLTLSL